MSSACPSIGAPYLVGGTRTVKWFWNRGLAGNSARPAGPVRRWRRRRAGSSVAVMVALAGISLPMVFAATASAMPPPIPPPVYVGVVGTDRLLYQKIADLATGFFSIGGQMTASPALTTISPSTLVAFSRGTNGAGYYDRYTEAGGLTGWRSIGGRLTSGLAAGSSLVAGKATTYTMGLGTDNQVYETDGNWASNPPSFSGWTRQTG